MKKIKLIVKTTSKKYSINIGLNIVKKISNIIKSNKINFEKCIIIVDKKVPKKKLLDLKNNLLCKKKIIHFFSPSEKNKNQKNVNIILNKLFKNNFNRNDCIISLGGGITGDVASFAASTFKRGIKFINVPTTLLAQVDSSIGGKTGINNKYGKNLIGTFFQPDLVVADTSFLGSLPRRELICGYAEIFKHSLIAGKKYFSYIEKNKFKILKLKSPYIEKAIAESCKIKKNIIEIDEKEKKIRKLLNLGHTFAHAYEAETGYSKKLNHGEAVILGIKNAIKYSKKIKLLSEENYILIDNHLNKLKINNKFKKIFKIKDINKILKFMKLDKKNKSDKVNLILIKNFGQIKTNYQTNHNNIKKFLYKEFK